MAKRLIAILSLAGILLAGCSEPTSTLTQHDCLEQNQFKYNDKCVDYSDIPQEDQEQVWNEVADEIAKAQGISKKEALEMIFEKIQENSDN